MSDKITLTPENTQVRTLGSPDFNSPLGLSSVLGDGTANFIPEESKVRYSVELIPGTETRDDIFFEKAGPREKIFFKPEKTKVAIVTCGGLCPGLNNVIRSVFLELFHNYHVRDVIGIRYGYKGFNKSASLEPIKLTSEFVENIHQAGGTVLGSSRGAEEPEMIADYLDSEGVDILFCIGGDGTLKGAHSIAEAVSAKGYKISIIGIPKTIDNDILFVWKTFGFSTAVEQAKAVLDVAHNEAKGAPSGISLVKVMGRDAGFIAASATLASQEVNFTLIPEIPFDLEGEKGFLKALKERMELKSHSVIVVSEGAGQSFIEGDDPVTAAAAPTALHLPKSYFFILYTQ